MICLEGWILRLAWRLLSTIPFAQEHAVEVAEVAAQLEAKLWAKLWLLRNQYLIRLGILESGSRETWSCVQVLAETLEQMERSKAYDVQHLTNLFTREVARPAQQQLQHMTAHPGDSKDSPSRLVIAEIWVGGEEKLRLVPPRPDTTADSLSRIMRRHRHTDKYSYTVMHVMQHLLCHTHIRYCYTDMKNRILHTLRVGKRGLKGFW